MAAYSDSPDSMSGHSVFELKPKGDSKRVLATIEGSVLVVSIRGTMGKMDWMVNGNGEALSAQVLNYLYRTRHDADRSTRILETQRPDTTRGILLSPKRCRDSLPRKSIQLRPSCTPSESCQAIWSSCSQAIRLGAPWPSYSIPWRWSTRIVTLQP